MRRLLGAWKRQVASVECSRRHAWQALTTQSHGSPTAAAPQCWRQTPELPPRSSVIQCCRQLCPPPAGAGSGPARRRHWQQPHRLMLEGAGAPAGTDAQPALRMPPEALTLLMVHAR